MSWLLLISSVMTTLIQPNTYRLIPDNHGEQLCYLTDTQRPTRDHSKCFSLWPSPRPPFLFVLLVNCFYRTSNRALCLSHRGRKPKEEKKSSIPTQPHPAQPRDNSRNPLPPRLHWHHNSAAVTLLSCWTVWGGEVGAVQLDCQIHWPLQESSTDPPAPYYSERLFYWESHSVFFCSANRLNTQTEPLTAETCAATRVSVTRYSSCAVWTNACASNNTIYQNYFQYVFALT